MAKRGVVCVVMAALVMGACANQDRSAIITDKPSADQMRAALKDLLARQPDLAIPEFALSVANSPAIPERGLVQIGSFECDPNTLSFDASLTAANLTMRQLEGRFERDPQHNWRAVVVRSSVTYTQDLSRRADWYPGGAYSWSKQNTP